MTGHLDALSKYCLHRADNSLVLGHRISEWCSKGPILEEDLALTNMALDKIGQSRFLYQKVAEWEGKGQTEDDFAYRRSEREFYNTILAEQPNGDFAYTIVRGFLNDNFEVLLFEAMENSSNPDLAAFAAKSVKELRYHCRHANQWMLRLGDGTEESHKRVQNALDDMWMYSGEMFEVTEEDKELIAAGTIPNHSSLKEQWRKNVAEIITLATLQLPADGWMQSGGRKGEHSEHLGFLLAEMQYLQRSYPDASW